MLLTKLIISCFLIFCFIDLPAQKKSVLDYFDIVYHDAKRLYFGNEEPHFIIEDLENQYLKFDSHLGTIEFITWECREPEKVVIVEMEEKCSHLCAQKVNVMLYDGKNFTESKKRLFPLEELESAANFYLPYIIKQFDFYEFWYEFIPTSRGLKVGYRVNYEEGFKLLPLADIHFNGEAFKVTRYYDPPPYLVLPENIKRFQPKGPQSK